MLSPLTIPARILTDACGSRAAYMIGPRGWSTRVASLRIANGLRNLHQFNTLQRAQFGSADGKSQILESGTDTIGSSCAMTNRHSHMRRVRCAFAGLS